VNVGLVGAGLIGRKRASALGKHRLITCADLDLERARSLAADHSGCLATSDLELVVRHPRVDVVLVATSNDALVPTALAAVEAGKHVLVEKPGARSVAELELLRRAVQRQGVIAKVGFNHRYHPGLRKARQLFDAGAVGELMYLRGRYGHGGRPGYEGEWRANRELAGGGELLDQGSHLIDLARWFAGEFSQVSGHLSTHFWPMEVEDNAFILLTTSGGQVAWLHTSWSEWKNLFSFEIFGRMGKLQIDGLGGSYGTEQLVYYRMLPQMGPPEMTRWEFPGDDESWGLEIDDLARSIRTGAQPDGSLDDAFGTLRIVERLYRASV